ncbi:Gfo/Idh/MocA family oxidoreductase [Radiobacillus kanasensis]|uniref:Gfo/Idh/MocA family protein n=1 Tax=Radiobacillus kanasensis TaxID=2844358 RepID=UPI001E3371C8|nr:Gfo/Idh/MocA family oxidoreductase [Radiobacillus kanasensis]UFT98865.1 Gfo/Idh/MocA family oxidoreductase [Radiobacillus kanasensis]
MQKINVGIIGCGSIARLRHVPEYMANPFVDQIYFYDRNVERARQLANTCSGQVVETIEELFQNPSITAISDCSSNDSHHIYSTEALLYGKHVLCEKPIAITVDHANLIIDAQKKSNKILMVDHNQRFNKAHQKAKEILSSKQLGEVLTFKTTFGHRGPEYWGINKSSSTWFFKKNRSHTGVAGDLGIHKIDLIHYLLDDDIQDIQAFHGALDKKDENQQPIEVCDNVVCIMKTKRGRIGTGSFSWTYYGSEDNSTIIYCQKGILKIYYEQEHQLVVEHSNGDMEKYKVEGIQTNDNQTNTGIVDHFVDCILRDRQPIITGDDALTSLKVIEELLNVKQNQMS